jgi:hypothetical protein
MRVEQIFVANDLTSMQQSPFTNFLMSFHNFAAIFCTSQRAVYTTRTEWPRLPQVHAQNLFSLQQLCVQSTISRGAKVQAAENDTQSFQTAVCVS